MRYTSTLLYSRNIPDLQPRLAQAIDRGCQRYQQERKIELFFRADDIGVPSGKFSQLTNLFHQHQLPLCLAVVPSWISRNRYAALSRINKQSRQLWCWHQHGRLHINFETEGKKQEFGPARDFPTVLKELSLGRQRLENILSDDFEPFFTPPWNRCSADTARALKQLDFSAISRFTGARPDCSSIIPDLQVNVDLHTRKEERFELSLANLLNQLESSLATGRCGIMIHHQRMNKRAFAFLDILLAELAIRKELSPCTFREMISL